LQRIAAPRAIRQVRRETGVESSFNDQTLEPPVGGDLLRAMRWRAGLATAQVAERLGVRPSTVGRWERSEMLPPVERWELLFAVLKARPEERSAFLEGGWLLAPANDRGPVSLDELQQWHKELDREVMGGNRALMELRFLTWEARLWPWVQRSEAAWEELGHGYSRFSQWLFWDGRDAEAVRYANRSLAVAMRDGRPRHGWLGPVHVHCMLLARAPGPGAARAMARLREWLPMARTPWEQALLYRDLATCAVGLGRPEAAIPYSAQACDAAERSGDANEIRMSRLTHGEVLYAADRFREAVRFLPQDRSPTPVRRCYEASAWAQVMLALGDYAAALFWLDELAVTVREHQLDSHQSTVDKLTRRLDSR
jgi:transcriptional regulator with XRE-family HTH domain